VRGGLGCRGAADYQVAELITTIHTNSGGTYGAVRITAALRQQGFVVNRKRGRALCVNTGSAV
jgi:hypothetical protein